MSDKSRNWALNPLNCSSSQFLSEYAEKIRFDGISSQVFGLEELAVRVFQIVTKFSGNHGHAIFRRQSECASNSGTG
jgi:hypothetical protein